MRETVDKICLFIQSVMIKDYIYIQDELTRPESFVKRGGLVLDEKERERERGRGVGQRV